MAKLKRIAVVLVAIMALLCLQIGVVGCRKGPQAKNAFFNDETTQTFTFDGDKALEEDLTIGRAVSFDLKNYSFDLNGYTLTVQSDAAGCLVEFKDGAIKNGKLVVSVPNGDVEFNKTELADNVDYELEAASETIRFANAKVLGKGVVKSETRVQMDFSEMGDITLAGNGSLEAGEGVTLKKLSVGASASGAKINISKFAAVADMAIAARAEVNIAGSVSSVTVDKNATDAAGIEVKVAETATVEKVQLDAPAKVDVKGEIKNVTVSETATSATEKVEVKVSSSAKVQSIDLQAKTDLEVKGAVGNMVVGDKANGTSVTVKGSDAAVGRVVVNAENTKVAASSNSSVSQVVVSKAVEEKVSVTPTVNKVIEENIENLVKTHTYVLTQTIPATCAKIGQEIYTCSDCGDSYHTPLAKVAHNYAKTGEQQPTQVKAGTITYTCTACGHSYNEHVQALDFSSESISAIIGLLVENGVYSISANEGSVITVYDLWDDYTDKTGYKTIFIINLAEAMLGVKDGVVKGTVKFEGGMIEIPYTGEGSVEDLGSSKGYADMQNLFSLYAYVDGDGILYELEACMPDDYTSVDMDVFGSISPNFIVEMLLENVSHGELSVNTLFEAMDVAKKLQTVVAEYQPFFNRVGEDIDFAVANMMTAEDLIDTIGENGFKKENVGENVVYTFTTKAIEDFATSLKTKTIEDIIDKKYGDGTVDNLIASINGLPTMTIREILGLASNFEQEYSFSIEKTIGVVEIIVSEASGEEIDITGMLESLYDYTIVDIVYENMGGNAGSTTKAQIEETILDSIDEVASMIKVATIDEWANMAMGPVFGVGGSGGPSGDPSQQMPAISDLITGLAYQFGETLSLSFVCDANGKLISVDSIITLSEEQPGEQEGDIIPARIITVSYLFAEGKYVISAEYGDYALSAEYDNATGTATAIVTIGEESYSATVTDGETGISGIVKAIDGAVASAISEDKTIADFITEKVTESDKIKQVLKQFNVTDLSVMGYDVSASYDKDTESASLIVENEGSVFMSATLTTDGDVHSLTLVAEDEELGTITFTDSEIKNGSFTTEITSYVMENKVEKLYSTSTITVNFTKVDGVDNAYKLSCVVDTEYADKKLGTEKVEEDIAISFARETVDEQTEEYENIVSFGIKVVITDSNHNNGEPQTVVDGVQTLTVMEKGGKYQGVNVSYDFKAQGGFGTKQMIDDEFGNNLDKPENNNTVETEIKAGYTVNFKEDKEIDDSDLDFISEKVETAGAVNYNSDDASVVYVNNGSEEYYAVTKKYTTNNIQAIKEYDEDKGEYVTKGYYGNLYTEEYYTQIPAVDGVPTYGFLALEEDCGEWYKFMIQAYSEAQYTYTMVGGLFNPTDDGFVLIQEEDSKAYTDTVNYNFDIVGYFNKDGESAKESQHNYKYECVEKNGKDCSGGLIVTRTCDGCSSEDVYDTNGCFSILVENSITTNTCGTSEIRTRYCVNCTESHYGYEGGFYQNHEFESYPAFEYNDPIEGKWSSSHREFTASDLERIRGKIPVIGSEVFHGEVHAKACVYCGLKSYNYNFYIKDDEDGLCRDYNLKEYVYDATNTHDEDYAFCFNMYYSHYVEETHKNFHSDLVSGDEGYAESQSAWNTIYQEVIRVFGKLPFSDYYQGRVVESRCLGCDKVTGEEVSLWRYSEGYLVIDKEYDYDGGYLGTHAHLQNCPSYIVDTLDKYVPNNLKSEVPGYGEYEVTLNRNDVVTGFHATLSYENDTLSINKYRYGDGEVYVCYYDWSACKEYFTTYDKNGNVISSSENERHDYTQYFSGVSCTEDGVKAGACRVCKKSDETRNGHSYSWFTDSYQYMTQDQFAISGLPLMVTGHVCGECYKMIDVSIVLQGNCVLTDNVFIYAEDITINLNGFTLDLNGYNFIVYGMAGSNVEIFDSNGLLEEPNVIDSSEEKTGWLVWFNKGSLGNGIVTAGYGLKISEDAHYFMSDTDTVDTIEESFYKNNVELNGIYELPRR